MTLGVNITNLAKVMKLGENDDTITLKADEDPSHLTLIFENPSRGRLTEFNINLIQIDSEHLSITDTEGGSTISMGSSDFSKICRELHALSETGKFRFDKSPPLSTDLIGFAGFYQNLISLL